MIDGLCDECEILESAVACLQVLQGDLSVRETLVEPTVYNMPKHDTKDYR